MRAFDNQYWMSRQRPCRKRCPSTRQEDQTAHPYHASKLPRQPAASSGAATPGSLGPLPFTHWGLWAPSLVCNAHAGLRVPLGQDWQLGRSLFGMPARGPSRPLESLGRFQGRRPFVRSTIARRQEATDPQWEVVSGPATPRVPTPRFLGVTKEWRWSSESAPFLN